MVTFRHSLRRALQSIYTSKNIIPKYGDIINRCLLIKFCAFRRHSVSEGKERNVSNYEELFKNSEEKVIDMLEELRDYAGYNIDYVFKLAVQNNYVKMVKILLDSKQVDPSVYDNYAIRYASDNEYVEVVKLLLQDGRADPSACDNYAIRAAAMKGYMEVVKLLLQDGRADPSACDQDAIIWASAYGHVEIIKLLMQDSRVDPSARYNDAIQWASINGYAEVVRLLKETMKK